MFEIKELPNVFSFISSCCDPLNEDDDVIDNKVKSETQKFGRPKSRNILTQDTMDQANKWNRFMADKGFIDVKYVIDDTGNVVSAVGSKNGLDHQITAEVRKMLEG